MSSINSKLNSQGFTIVELLIVIVVIAILAAITIVSYNGITNRANSSAAAAAAATVQKKAEIYAADSTTKRYPKAVADLSGAATSTSYYLSGITGGTALPTSSNGTNTVRYLACVSGSTPASQAAIVATAITGAVITYYDFTNSTTKDITMGNIGTGVGAPTSFACPNA